MQYGECTQHTNVETIRGVTLPKIEHQIKVIVARFLGKLRGNFRVFNMLRKQLHVKCTPIPRYNRTCL